MSNHCSRDRHGEAVHGPMSPCVALECAGIGNALVNRQSYVDRQATSTCTLAVEDKSNYVSRNHHEEVVQTVPAYCYAFITRLTWKVATYRQLTSCLRGVGDSRPQVTRPKPPEYTASNQVRTILAYASVLRILLTTRIHVCIIKPLPPDYLTSVINTTGSADSRPQETRPKPPEYTANNQAGTILAYASVLRILLTTCIHVCIIKPLPT